METAECVNCGKDIGKWTDPRGGHPEWMHAPSDGPDAYKDCICGCSDCDPKGGDIVPCCDGCEAEPKGVAA